LVQGDDRNPIFLEIFENLFFEGSESHLLVLIPGPKLIEAVLPLVPIEHLGNGIHQSSVFFLRCRKVARDLTAEVRPFDLVLRNADDRLLAVDDFVDRLWDVDIEPAADLFLFRRDGFNNLTAQGYLVERGHPLLAVQKEGSRRRLAGGGGSAFYGTRFEVHRTACVERHERANRKGSGDRRDQALYTVLIPNPTALKIRELNDAAVAFVEELIEVDRIRLKRRACHLTAFCCSLVTPPCAGQQAAAGDYIISIAKCSATHRLPLARW
jgi:hypothetical protein